MEYTLEKDGQSMNVLKDGKVIGRIDGYVTFCVNNIELDNQSNTDGVISLLKEIATKTDGGVFMYIHQDDLDMIKVVKELGGTKISRRKYLTFEIKG